MPFKSKSQMRAAFGGYLGPEMKARAKTWAQETPNIKNLPTHKNMNKHHVALAKHHQAMAEHHKEMSKHYMALGKEGSPKEEKSESKKVERKEKKMGLEKAAEKHFFHSRVR